MSGTHADSDVVLALLDAGWRLEYLPGAELPVLTNAPQGEQLCIKCGEWQRYDFFPAGLMATCRACVNRK